MEPDGKLHVWMIIDPWDQQQRSLDEEAKPQTWKFTELLWWRKEGFGIFIKHTEKNHTFIPWQNIVAVEVECNSDEYVLWQKDRGSRPITDPDLHTQEREL
jgi:hypothetical protein